MSNVRSWRRVSWWWGRREVLWRGSRGEVVLWRWSRSRSKVRSWRRSRRKVRPWRRRRSRRKVRLWRDDVFRHSCRLLSCNCPFFFCHFLLHIFFFRHGCLLRDNNFFFGRHFMSAFRKSDKAHGSRPAGRVLRGIAASTYRKLGRSHWFGPQVRAVYTP